LSITLHEFAENAGKREALHYATTRPDRRRRRLRGHDRQRHRPRPRRARSVSSSPAAPGDRSPPPATCCC
jgi:hypothetical protein